jgi:hypothetical protein
MQPYQAFSAEEDTLLAQSYAQYGDDWTRIMRVFNHTRTAHALRNRWMALQHQQTSTTKVIEDDALDGLAALADIAAADGGQEEKKKKEENVMPMILVERYRNLKGLCKRASRAVQLGLLLPKQRVAERDPVFIQAELYLNKHPNGY